MPRFLLLAVAIHGVVVIDLDSQLSGWESWGQRWSVFDQPIESSQICKGDPAIEALPLLGIARRAENPPFPCEAPQTRSDRSTQPTRRTPSSLFYNRVRFKLYYSPWVDWLILFGTIVWV